MIERYIENLYVGDDFLAKGEYAGGFLFFHCELFQHNKSTIKKVKRALEEALFIAHQLGYDKPAFSYVESGPRCKLSKLAGGEYCGTFIEDNKTFEVFKWELKQQQ